MKSKKGFTLGELLIVVAIIGVLVSVSIPIFMTQIDKAKASVDKANVRSAKAAAVADYLTDFGTGKTYYYDASSGTITTDEETAKAYKGYGQSSTDLADDNATGIPLDHIVSITISDTGDTSASWILGSGSESGGGSSGSGIIPISSSQWSDWPKAGDGTSVPAGTIISKDNVQYLFFANNTYYAGDYRNTKLADVYQTGSLNGLVEKITDSTVIYTSENFLDNFDGKVVPAGTIVKTNNGYLSLASAYTANKYNLPLANNNNWVTIK